MEHSKYYNFNLPSSDVDGIADVNKLSENFREVDRILGDEALKKSDVLQGYDPSSAEPISAAAVADAIQTAAPNITYTSAIVPDVGTVKDALDYLENDSLAQDHRILELESRADIHETELALKASTEYVNEKTEWKTVLNTTLTEEQGGVTSLLLALDDAEAVANARRMRLHIAFPQKEALAANKAWLSVTLQNKTASTYALRLLDGYNVAASANTTLYSMASVEISDFGLTNNFKRSFVSVQQLPNPYYTASANSSANARIITGGYKSDSMVEYPPYLNITIGDVTAFNAGTKVFVEVQQ
jgi:hypothetical protein